MKKRIDESDKEKITGHFGLRMPGSGPYLWTAAEAQNVPRRREVNLVRSALTAVRFITPHRMRIANPQAPWFDMLAGSAAILPAYCRFWLDTTKAKAPSHRMWVSFLWMNGTSLDDMTKNRWGCARLSDPDEILPSLFDPLLKIVRENPDDGNAFWPLQYAGGRLAAALESSTSVGDGIFNVGRPADGTTDSFVGRILTYLRLRLKQKITIADIADHLGASESLVSHRFKSMTGETPMRTLKRMRIEQAKMLIAKSVHLNRVADMTGFCDIHHLSKEFKRHEGLSPTGFRNQIQKGTGTRML